MAKDTFIKLRCTDEFKTQIEALADKKNRSVSNYIENLLKLEIAKNKEELKMTIKKVLENLKGLVGQEFNEDDIICAFEDFEEDGEAEVITKDSENSGYDKVAYINSSNSTQFLFTVDKNDVITKVWTV